MKKVTPANASPFLPAIIAVVVVAPLFTPLLAAQTTADEEAGGLACAACAGIFLIIPLIVLVISLIIGVWMYKDAQRRGNPQAVLWLVLGILFNVVGLLIYLAVRKSNDMSPPPPPVV